MARYANVKHIMIELAEVRMRSGKHVGKRFATVYEEHPEYVEWRSTHLNCLGNQKHAFVEYSKLRRTKDN